MLASPAEAAFQERQQAQRASERGAQCDVLSAEVAVAEAEEQLLAVKLARLQLSRDARKVPLSAMQPSLVLSTCNITTTDRGACNAASSRSLCLSCTRSLVQTEPFMRCKSAPYQWTFVARFTTTKQCYPLPLPVGELQWPALICYLLVILPQDADRVESGKAATLAGAVGGLASLPYALTTSPSVLTALVSAASAGVSAALFGIVYRYARREDGDTDSQLKGGAVAAFAVVRTLAMVDSRVQTEALTPATLSYEVLKPFALIALAQLFIFAFASVALEAALTKGFLAPIPGDRMAD